PDCFNDEVQRYTSKKALYCQGIGIAKKGVQVALDSNTMNEFIGLMHIFIKSKSIQVDNSLRSNIIGLITNPHDISHHGQPKKQLYNSLEIINKSNFHQIFKSNK
ncbi:19060_t:CDS:1, partial [Racocetra persica]